MANILESEMALHLDVDASDYIAPTRKHTGRKKTDKNSYITFEPIPDHLPAKDIAAISQVCGLYHAEHRSSIVGLFLIFSNCGVAYILCSWIEQTLSCA